MFSSCELKLTGHNGREVCRRCKHLIVVCDVFTFVNALQCFCVHVGLAIPKHANENSSDVPGCEGSVRRWPGGTDIIILKVCVRAVAETKRNLLRCNDIHFHIYGIMVIAKMMAGLYYSSLLFPTLSFSYPYSLYSTVHCCTSYYTTVGKSKSTVF
jgi:hypothetical protein